VIWPEEAQLIVDVNNASRLAGGSLFLMNVEVIRAYYDHLVNCDLAADLRLAEADGRPVGYVRVDWLDENRGDRVHGAALFVTPDEPLGAFGALLDWILARHLEIAAAQGSLDHPRTASISTLFEPPDARSALGSRGFVPVRHGFEMLRPSLEDIPEVPVPAGIEVRPVEPEQRRRIWEAEVEAFAGHWGAGADDRSEERWQEFLADPLMDLSLWQVAWDGDEVAGMVRPFINADENTRFDVRRGWCENISTRAAWRGRGVASALIVRALRALRERGMTEAALGVDAQNETGALRLYQKMGFREAARETEWRRPLFLDGSPATEAGS
jgi:ribosomal protein S18 acetylase RimI-like enzyme